MYEATTADQLRRGFGLPPDDRVDLVLAAGSWDLLAETGQRPHLVRALTRLGLGELASGPGPDALRRFDHPQLGHASGFRHAGRRVWFVPVMGTAVMAQYLHAACLLGARRMVLVGSVGGLSPALPAGSLVVPDRAEGTHSAWMYHRGAPAGTRPDPGLAAALVRRLRAALPDGVPVAQGPTTTCETILAETADDVRAWSGAGFLGVEMEAALTFAVGHRFGVPAAAVLHVADTLVDQVGFLDPGYADTAPARAEARQVQYDAAVAELLELP